MSGEVLLFQADDLKHILSPVGQEVSAIVPGATTAASTATATKCTASAAAAFATEITAAAGIAATAFVGPIHSCGAHLGAQFQALGALSPRKPATRQDSSSNAAEEPMPGVSLASFAERLELGLDEDTSRAMVREAELRRAPNQDAEPDAAMFKKQRQAAPGDALSFLALASSINFQVYSFIHIMAVVAAVKWFSWQLLGVCMALYTVRMFGITGGYHRLLSHRSFKTSRVGQFVLAWLGSMALQKGPLWWCSHHRHHHRTADTVEDAHSPIQWGFWWSHVGWFLCSAKSANVQLSTVPDLARYPELRWLDRYHYVPPFMMGAALYLSGGLPMLGWGFFVSTVLCWHATYCINSVAHLVGKRRYRCEFNTHCDARNNIWLAIATLGEGWHNNHHCYMRSAKHGFYFYEIDVTYYVLLVLSYIGIVWDLELPPLKQLELRRYDAKSYKCRCEKVEEDLRATAAATIS